MTWSYIKYGDPTNFYIPLPPESKDRFTYPKPRRSRLVHRPPALPPPPRTPAPVALPASITPPCPHTPTTVIPLSSYVTIRRRPRPRPHLTHTQFLPYTLSSKSENSVPYNRIEQPLTPLLSCQGICSLSSHIQPDRAPIFITSQVLNPLQKCNGTVLSMSPYVARKSGEPILHCNLGDENHSYVHHDSDQGNKYYEDGQKRCQLILCTYCVRFLDWHKGRVGKMLRWWKGWLARKEKEDIEGDKDRMLKMPMWNMTWENGHLMEARRELNEETEKERRKSEKGKQRVEERWV